MFIHEIILGLINLTTTALTFAVRMAMRRYVETHCQPPAKKATSSDHKPLDTLDRELCKERDFSD